MMMIGETMVMNPKVETLPWDSLEDPAAAIASYFTNPYVFNSNAASNASSGESPTAFESLSLCEEDMLLAVDAFSCDHFRMFEFKVRTCARGRSHDWTKCPYAHPGEKARRRDPRKHHYSGTECPELRHGCCKKGDSCEFSHGVFESWLHPDRYRTQPCRDGMSCRRRVCFFAHSTEQLRVPSKQNLRSPRAKGTSISSPTSILLSPSISPSSDSPPMSPISPINSNESFASASRLVTLMHNLQLGDSQETPQSPWGNNPNMSGFCSPRVSSLRQGQQATFDLWDKAYEEEPAMERVESGKNLRAQMYAKLMRENSVERVHSWPPLISAGSRS